MKKLRIKTGDLVKVVAGKDKGKTGKVIQTFPKMNRVVVEGVGTAKKHLRNHQGGQKGQTIEFFMPLDASNVQPVDSSGKAMRHDDKPKV